jgi:mRNA-degrading endonuclease toxin of MazEF toxin-antitoxin module
MIYKKGDIVIVRFPFIAREGHEKQKGRPAVVLSDDTVKHRYKDLVLAAITSQIPKEVTEMEIILEVNELTGLVKKSLLRLDFIMTVPDELISRKIGFLSDEILKIADEKLTRLFGITL